MANLVIGEDFPLVCESCLGPNPYVRMTKSPNGTECKISKRPCTMFEWRANGVKKQTCIAYAVAAQKNICQCCMTDLTFGLPVGVRDAFLKKAMEKGVEGVSETFGTLPQSRVGQDYLFNRLNDARASAEAGTLLLKDDSTEAISSLMKGAVAHTQSFEGFNFRLPEICSTWVNTGSCNQRKNCGKRPCCGLYKFPELGAKQAEHLEGELKAAGPENFELDDHIKQKLLRFVEVEKKKITHKEEPNRTLFVSQLAQDVDESTLKSTFSKFSGVVKVSLVGDGGARPKVGFVEFDTKANAEFVLSLSGLTIGSGTARLSWARPKQSHNGDDNNHERRPSKVHSSDHAYKKDTRPQNKDDRHVSNGSEAKRARTEDKSSALTAQEKKPQSATAPAALLAAMQMRKAKGLDDE